MTIPKDWAFEKAEYERRLAAVRELMSERTIDVLVCFSAANIYYLSGLEDESLADTQALIVPLRGEPTLVLFWFEAGRAANGSWVDQIVTYDGRTDPIGAVAQVAASEAPKVVAIDAGDGVTPPDHRRLLEAINGRRIATIDGVGIVEAIRLRKSAPEIAYMTAAAAITDRAIMAGLALLKEGAVDRELAAAIMSVAYGEGDPTPFGPIVAAGFRSGTPHSTFAGATLRRGDPVFLEITAARRRYTAPIMRTGVVGSATPEMRSLSEAGGAAIEAVLATAKPGITASAVASAALKELKPVLEGVAFHNTIGYPVGAGFPLTWAERLNFLIRTENQRPLEPGMLFHLPISLRRFGELGICQSETILITDTGATSLTKSPRALYVSD